MASEKSKPLPVESAAQNPVGEILSKSAMEILQNATEADLIAPDPNEERIPASANPSGCWVHSPATVQLFAVADKRLTRIANSMGMNVKEVERVYVRLINGSKLIVIKPAPHTDLSALPVSRYEGQSGAYINIITLLGPKKLTVKPGWRERFEVAYVPTGYQVGPGLVFDLSSPTDRRRASKKQENEETAPAKDHKAKGAKAEAAATPAAAAQPMEAKTEPAKKDEGAGQA